MNFFDKDLNKDKIYFYTCNATYVNIHTHNFLELAYVLEGEADHLIDGKKKKIEKGDYFVVDYCSSHSYRALGDTLTIINCLFLPELIDASLIHCTSLNEVISNYRIHLKADFFTANPGASVFHDDDGRIRELLGNMNDEYNKKQPGYLQLISSKLIEIIVLTMRKIYLDPRTEVGGMENAILYINENYMKEISLADISRVTGYSVPYLSTKLKACLGMTYGEYLKKIRAEQSMRLLRETDMPIDIVSQSVGYRDLKSFYAAFRKYSGTTPLRFRRLK